MALVGNLRLWTVQELVSSVLLCNYKSIQDETVTFLIWIFVYILSSRKREDEKDLYDGIIGSMCDSVRMQFFRWRQFNEYKEKDCGSLCT